LEEKSEAGLVMASIGIEEEIRIGEEVVLESNSSSSEYGVVFEDEGTTGYLYALEFGEEEDPIVDAMQIYNVSSVVDRDEPSTIKILWSDDGVKAALLINDYPHAVVDFANHQAFCRTNFPSPGENWTRPEWSDQAFEDF
jgi:hypothetical protein